MGCNAVGHVKVICDAMWFKMVCCNAMIQENKEKYQTIVESDTQGKLKTHHEHHRW